MVDLDGLTAPAVLFEGSVRDGAPLYPGNVNISAAAAFAGAGLDRTTLVIVADPTHMASMMPTDQCRKSVGDATGGFFDGAAIVARLHPFDWRFNLVFSFTPEGRAAFGESGVNDGLVDVRELARAGLGAMGVVRSLSDRTGI